MKGNTVQDVICLNNETLCYESEFVLVNDHFKSNYMFGINQTDVGGIIGMGMSTNVTTNAFWTSGLWESQ